MEKLKKQFKSWDSLFQKAEYQVIYKELKNLIVKADFTYKDEALLAYWCLVTLNITSKKAFSNAITDFKCLPDLHRLSILCCDLLSRSWISVECDFVTSVFYICKLLLLRKYINEACEIGQFVFKYFDEVPNAKLLFKADEINVPSRFIGLFLHATSTFPINSEENEKLIYLWNTILSSSERRIMRANILSVVDYFSSFLLKIKKEDFLQREHDLIPLIKMLTSRINASGNDEKIFFKFLRTSVNKLCEFSSKSNSNFFLNCVIRSSANQSVALQFCENIYRICSGNFENGNASDAIVNCSRQLQTLIEDNSPILNDVVYCASIITFKMQLKKVSEYSLEKITVRELFKSVLTLATRLFDIDINVLFLGKKEGTKRTDSGTVATLALDLISCCTMIKNLDLEDETIYKCVLEAEKLAITNMKSMDEKRKEQLQDFFGPSCINVCRTYMMANLHSQCKELCTNMLQYYSTLSVSDLSSPSVKLYVNKLVTCLCLNYRSLEMYVDWMGTALAWSLITPANESSFMEQYCTAKYKLLSTNVKSSYTDCTCVEFLKKVRSQWNLKTYSRVQISLMELKAYLTNNLILSTPLTKVIEDLEGQDSSDRILIGNLHYAKFRLKLLQFRKENEAEVKSLAPNKTDLASEENDYVLASYNFHNQKEVLTLLNTAVDNWTAAIEESQNSSQPTDCLKELELSYLKEAAFIYRLYCDSVKEIDVWELLFVASKCIQNKMMAVYAVCNLMGTSWKFNSKWIKEVEGMLDKVEEALQFRYRLDRYNKGFVEGFTSDEKKSLKEITLECATKHNLRAKYCYLMARVHFYRILEDTADSFGMSYIGISTLMGWLKHAKWNDFTETCESECMLLDMSVFMTARCIEKFELENAKVFSQESLKMVQTLGLPLRTCQLLNLSAYLDSIVGRMEDCYVKLQYSSSILNYNIKPTTKIQSGFDSSIPATSDLRFVSTDYDIDFEDNPALNSELQFEVPAFAYHSKKCECDICVNGEYLKLYCELISLYGTYFRLLGKWLQADGFFQGVFKLLKFARKRVDIVELKVFTLTECGNYWAAKNSFKEAALCTQKALKLLNVSQMPNFSLKEACLDQYWQQFAVKFFKEIEESRTAQDEQKEIPSLKFLEQVEASSTYRKLQKAAAAQITPLPRKSRKVLLFDDFSTPPKQNATDEDKEFTTPPAIVMQLPSTVQKRRTRRRMC